MASRTGAPIPTDWIERQVKKLHVGDIVFIPSDLTNTGKDSKAEVSYIAKHLVRFKDIKTEKYIDLPNVDVCHLEIIAPAQNNNEISDITEKTISESLKDKKIENSVK